MKGIGSDFYLLNVLYQAFNLNDPELPLLNKLPNVVWIKLNN